MGKLKLEYASGGRTNHLSYITFYNIKLCDLNRRKALQERTGNNIEG